MRSDLSAAIVAAYADRWDEALDLLVKAANSGDADAHTQLALLAGANPAEDPVRLRSAIDLGALLSPPPLVRLSERAAVGVSRSYAPAGFCTRLIERAQHRLQRSMINAGATGDQRLDPSRTALVSAFGPDDRDMILAVLQTRAARLSQLPISQHEAPNVISYEPGQKFGLHVDFIDPSIEGFQRELQVLGQRTITIVTYLNDDYEGGATQFPALGFEFRGQVGDALAFQNVLPNGQPDRNTVHAGLPPTRGRKWVLSQWLRDRPQPFAMQMG